MGFLRKFSDSDIQGETYNLVHTTVQQATGATISAEVTPNNNRDKKKRKRDENSLLASAPAAFNEVSYDSDVSSDEEKSPQEELSRVSKECHLRLDTKKRTKYKKGRRVFFGESISTTKYHAATLTKAELRDLKKDLWFTKQDRIRSQAECLEVIKAFRIQNAEEVMRFSDVYRTSMQVPFSQESSDYLERATVSVPLTIRGMEWGIAPKLKKRRKEHIQSVLSLQGHITNVELRERFVSNRSLQSSRPARIMARMIGEGDALTSKLGITSTALNIKISAMTKTKKKTAMTTSLNRKLHYQEQRRHNRNNTEISNDAGIKNEISSEFVAKPKKMGHARRPRRQLWRKTA